MKMKVLAIDTSSKRCSICISEDTTIITYMFNDDEKTHSVKLMPMLEKAFKETNLSLDDISLLVCCTGPGSFTGVRIGIATVKAFSDVKNTPVVGISSLESLAYNVKGLAQNNSLVCSLIDAKNENVYCGLYSFNNTICNQLLITFDNINEIIQKLKNISADYDNIIFVGDASNIYINEIKSTFTNVIFASDEQNMQSGCSLITAGFSAYQKMKFGNSDTLHPVYLRKSQAERDLEKNIKISEMTELDLNLITPIFNSEFDEFWNISTLKDDLQENSSTYFVAKINEEVVGFAGIKKIYDVIEIMNIVTKVNKRHLGIGTKLLNYLIDNAKQQNVKTINLEVNENNQYAIALYEKFNFKRIGLRKKYYNNTDDAILMTLDI